MSFWYFIFPILIMLCIAVCWFFANSEMAMLSSNRLKLKSASKAGDKRADIILALLNNPERLFGTTLVGTNLASIVSTVCSDYYFQVVLEEPLKTIGVGTDIPLDLFTSCIMVPMVLIFGELYPMYVARAYPNVTALRNAKLIKAAYFVLYPLMLLISNISKGVSKILKSNKNSVMTRDELEMLVVGKSTEIPNETKKIISDVFDINQITAEDVMVHLSRVVAINENATVGELRKLLKKYSYNRIPVYRDSIFNITGTVHAVSIIGCDNASPISEYKDKLYIVPSSKSITRILAELKRNRKYMGIVVDEFGAACGILTLEDIVNEIVPDMAQAEQNDAQNKTETRQDVVYDASTPLDVFADSTGIDFTDEDAQTLGGLLNIALGRIGTKGETVDYKGTKFEIVDATDRVVNKVKLINDSEESNEKKNSGN